MGACTLPANVPDCNSCIQDKSGVVCGADGKSYKNKCFAFCAGCDNYSSGCCDGDADCEDNGPSYFGHWHY